MRANPFSASIVTSTLLLTLFLPQVTVASEDSAWVPIPSKRVQKKRIPLRRLAEIALPTVVTLTVRGADGKPKSLGSGFYIRQDIIATNFHVIEGGYSASAQLGNGRSVEVAGVLNVDVSRDLALLIVSTTKAFGVSQVKSLQITNGNEARVGDTVVAFGSPQGLGGSMSTGIISGLRSLNGTRIIQTTAPISQGSSGGPLLNEYGEVVGITSFMLRTGQNLNFAYSAYYIKQLMQRSTKNDYVPWKDFRSALANLLNKPQDEKVGVPEKGNIPPAVPTAPPKREPSVESSSGVERQSQDLFNQARDLSDKRDFDGAIAKYREGLRIKPDSYEAHFNLAAAYFNHKRYEEAIIEYKEVLRIAVEGKSVEGKSKFEGIQVRYNLGQSYHCADDYDNAIAQYQAAIQLWPENAGAELSPEAQKWLMKIQAPLSELLGRALLGKKRFAEAIAAFQESLRINPAQPTTRLNLGLALYGSGERLAGRLEWREVLRMGDPKAADQAQEYLDMLP